MVEHAFCQVPVCADAGIHEGILHICSECPVAQRVTAWVGSLWAAVVGGRTPPRSAAVFLLGDRRAWDPGGGGLCELWGIVRLAALFFMWDMRCTARQRGHPTSARAVVAVIVTHLRGRIRDDSLRALPDSPDAAAPFGARPRGWICCAVVPPWGVVFDVPVWCPSCASAPHLPGVTPAAAMIVVSWPAPLASRPPFAPRSPRLLFGAPVCSSDPP